MAQLLLKPTMPMDPRKALRQDRGFTLIEIMVVVAIVAIMSVVALFAINDSRPYRQLKAGTTQINVMLQQTRARAIRSARPYKACIFKQGVLPNDPLGNPDRGRVLILGCRPGKQCTGTAGVDLDLCKPGDPNFVDTTKVCINAATCGINPPGPGCGTCNWGLIAVLERMTESGTAAHGDFSFNDHFTGIPNTYVDGFVDNTGAVHGSDANMDFIELAFSKEGIIDFNNTCAFDGSSCTNLTGGGPNIVSAGVRVGHTKLPQERAVVWSGGGTTRSRDCNAQTGDCDL